MVESDNPVCYAEFNDLRAACEAAFLVSQIPENRWVTALEACRERVGFGGCTSSPWFLASPSDVNFPKMIH
jgi:hypothetical protein